MEKECDYLLAKTIIYYQSRLPAYKGSCAGKLRWSKSEKGGKRLGPGYAGKVDAWLSWSQSRRQGLELVLRWRKLLSGDRKPLQKEGWGCKTLSWMVFKALRRGWMGAERVGETYGLRTGKVQRWGRGRQKVGNRPDECEVWDGRLGHHWPPGKSSWKGLDKQKLPSMGLARREKTFRSNIILKGKIRSWQW